ncbi:MAG: class II aldolase/adducin family protein [Pirellulaceae bacterium]
MLNTHKIKQDICEIGRRIYAKGFAAANDGNITVRIGENEVLCTPTMHCKGFLKPEDISTVDMTGKQIAGTKKRSSEALLHLEIYKQRADVKSVVHCHPPHACAFAIAREPIPQCVLPEVEVFLGDVPITKYETPGGQAFADTVLPFVQKTNVIILANHGTVSYGENVERAYWWTEILDAYCRMLMLAKGLGRVNYFDEGKERELLDLKQKWGWSDPRNTEEYKNCDVCANDIFRDSWKAAGIERKAFEAPPPMGPNAAKAAAPSSSSSAPMSQEALVQMITQRVMEELAKSK